MFLRDTSEISNRIALADAEGTQLTYGELEHLSMKYRRLLPARSLIMILCDYSIETVAFYYTQMTNHVVPILVDKNLDKELILNIIKIYEPQFIWCSQQEINKLQEVFLKKIIQEKNYMVAQTFFCNYNLHPDLALLLTTSGSTGSLKMVRLSYENIRNESLNFGSSLGIKEDDRGISTLPMYFCYGLSILHMHWIVGACMYVTEYSMLNTKFWEFMKVARITNFAGVPYTYEILARVGFLEKNFEAMRFMSQAGAKLSDHQQREFGMKLGKKGIKLYLCYGQTELTSAVTVLSHEKILKKLGSVGEAIAGMSISVHNPNDKGEGELICRGKCVSMGYALSKSDLIQGNSNLEYLYTGDVGYIDDEGDIFIKGRKSRFVKILGIRVSLDELEAMLSAYLNVERIVCTGNDNKIDIYYRENYVEAEILKFCSRKLLIPKNMIECHLLKDFPYTGNGKIKYAEL